MTTDATASSTPAPTVAELQAELASARADLLASWSDLTAEVSPQALAKRAGDSAKAVFVDADGAPRVKNIAIAAGAVVGVLALRMIFRRR